MKLSVTDHRTFSRPLLICDQCRHYRSLRDGGRRLCTYFGAMTEPTDFCSKAAPRMGGKS